MKVKELIEELSKLPQDAEIGTFDTGDGYVSNCVCIYSKNDIVVCGDKYVTLEEVEQMRLSNEARICDFYIG